MTKQLLITLVVCLLSLSAAKAADGLPPIANVTELIDIWGDLERREAYFPEGIIDPAGLPEVTTPDEQKKIFGYLDLHEAYYPDQVDFREHLKKSRTDRVHQKSLPKIETMEKFLQVLQNQEKYSFCFHNGQTGVEGLNIPRLTKSNLRFVLAHKELSEQYFSGPDKRKLYKEKDEIEGYNPDVLPYTSWPYVQYEPFYPKGEGCVDKARQFFGVHKDEVLVHVRKELLEDLVIKHARKY